MRQACTILFATALATLLFAKGPTRKVSMAGGDLRNPVEVTDANAVLPFFCESRNASILPVIVHQLNCPNSDNLGLISQNGRRACRVTKYATNVAGRDGQD